MTKTAKTFILLILAISIAKSAFTTAQRADVLYYNGDTLYLFANPLEQLYTIETRPNNFFGNEKGCRTTACWRGYVGYWIIEDENLFLIDIKSCCYDSDSISADLNSLFGVRFQENKVKADWLTGEIIAPIGKEIYYEHMGYASIYEKENSFTFKNGLLIDQKVYDNSKSNRSEFELDHGKLKQFIFTNIDWEIFPEVLQEPVKISSFIFTDPLGKIDSVDILSSTHEKYNSEVSRVIKLIPQWTVFFKHGEFYPMRWRMPIFIDEEIRKEYGN